jgi:hypothetical protein
MKIFRTHKQINVTSEHGHVFCIVAFWKTFVIKIVSHKKKL